MPKVTGLGHVGIYVRDPQLMIEFYSGFLGLSVTDRGPEDRIVFLSANPAIEHHEFAMVKSADRKTDPQQISFTVATLADLSLLRGDTRARIPGRDGRESRQCDRLLLP